MYLYITNDGSLSQSSEKPTSDDCENHDNGVSTIIRFNNGYFEIASTDSDEVPDDEDEEDGDTHTEYSISFWTRI